MGISSYKVDGSEKVKLNSFPTDSKSDKVDKEEIIKKTEKILKKWGFFRNVYMQRARKDFLLFCRLLMQQVRTVQSNML